MSDKPIVPFSEAWFARHQWWLRLLVTLWQCRLPWAARRGVVAYISPQAIHVWCGRETYNCLAFPRPAIAWWVRQEFSWLWATLHVYDYAADALVPALSADLALYYSQAGSGGANVVWDGYMQANGTNATFAALHDATDATNAYAVTNEIFVQLRGDATTDRFNRLARAFVGYDTRAIPSGSSVTSAVNYMGDYYAESWTNALGDTSMHVVQATLADPKTASTTEFDAVGSTSFGNWPDLASWTAGMNAITLNGSGRAAVGVNAVTTFAYRLGWDINNSFTGTWASGASTHYSLNGLDADAGNPTRQHYLDVTYTAGAAPRRICAGIVG